MGAYTDFDRVLPLYTLIRDIPHYTLGKCVNLTPPIPLSSGHVPSLVELYHSTLEQCVYSLPQTLSGQLRNQDTILKMAYSGTEYVVNAGVKFSVYAELDGVIPLYTLELELYPVPSQCHERKCRVWWGNTTLHSRSACNISPTHMEELRHKDTLLNLSYSAGKYALNARVSACAEFDGVHHSTVLGSPCVPSSPSHYHGVMCRVWWESTCL